MPLLILMPSYEDLFRQLARHKLRIREAAHGSSRMPRPGRGSLFYDRRSYTAGDDIRMIDWHAYARTHQPWIKLTEHEAEKTLHIILDTSMSMSLAGKWNAARRITAGIIFLAARQNIPTRLTLHPADIHLHGKSMGFLADVLRLLERTMPAGHYTPLSPRQEHATQIILITDAHIPWHPLPSGTRIIRILNEADREPSMPILAEDSETHVKRFITPGARRQADQRREEAWHELIRQKGVDGITYWQHEDILSLFERITE